MEAGLLGEFASPDALLDAALRLRDLGLSRLDAFTPYPVPEVEDALGVRRSRIAFVVLPAALTGAALAYLVQWWTSAVDWPLDVGGRATHAALAFVPIAFETAVLFGATAALASLLVATGLPRLAHPLFCVEAFASASVDRFWIAVDLTDPRFARGPVEEALRASGALRVEPFGAPA
jgi:hypothetical protein